MGEGGSGAAELAESATVVVAGRLAVRPRLTDLPQGGNLCEVDVKVNDQTIPVRCTGSRATQMAGYEEDCFVRLRGNLRHFTWQNSARTPQERMVVQCREILFVKRAHDPQTVGDLP